MEIQRDVTMRFYRHAPIPELGLALRTDEIEIERNGVKRTYTNPNNARYNRINKIIHENHISLGIDLCYFTEITFQADKEIDDSEADESLPSGDAWTASGKSKYF